MGEAIALIAKLLPSSSQCQASNSDVTPRHVENPSPIFDAAHRTPILDVGVEVKNPNPVSNAIHVYFGM